MSRPFAPRSAADNTPAVGHDHERTPITTLRCGDCSARIQAHGEPGAWASRVVACPACDALNLVPEGGGPA